MIETGVYFGDIHSFYDLNLILSSVEIAPASPKTNYVDIPGADGALDLTEAHGEVKYSDRTHKFTLTMNPADDLSEAAWEAKKTEVSNRLNGRACRITLDKDPDYFWQGRCVVDSYKSNKRLRQFVVAARVRPYKYKQTETVVSVCLDDYVDNTSGAIMIPDVPITLKNARKSVCPSITCTKDDTQIEFNGDFYKFSAGTHKNLNIRLVEGDNELIILGMGTVTFSYQEGDL